MGPTALLYPVMAQILLTFVLIVLTGRARIAAIRAGKLRVREIALRGEAWPDEVRKIANKMHNQYETPILFFVLCGMAIYLGASGWLMNLLAWGYVATRLVHAVIHTTSNNVRRRFQVFVVGLAILAVMWLLVAFRLIGLG